MDMSGITRKDFIRTAKEILAGRVGLFQSLKDERLAKRLANFDRWNKTHRAEVEAIRNFWSGMGLLGCARCSKNGKHQSFDVFTPSMSPRKSKTLYLHCPGCARLVKISARKIEWDFRKLTPTRR